MKHLPLRNSPGMFALVDDEDYPEVSQYRWNLARNGYVVSYRKVDDRKFTVFLHRVIMNAPARLQVDHVSRDKLDNRRINLRFATRSQNQANKGVSINNPVGLKGVTIEGDKYRARIRFDKRKRLHLGNYESAETAARVYDAASRLLNAEFAGCNYPEELTRPEILAIVSRYIQRSPEALEYLDRVGRLNLLEFQRAEGPLVKETDEMQSVAIPEQGETLFVAP